MKLFFKWTFKAFLLLAAVEGFSILFEGFDKTQIGRLVVGASISSVTLGLLFCLLEVKYIPWKKKSLTKKLIKVFDAEPISETVAYFKLGSFDFYTELEFNLRMSMYAGNVAIVNFHIPRQQIDRFPIKPDFKLRQAFCNGMATYKIYQTNGLGLKLAKRRFEKKLIV